MANPREVGDTPPRRGRGGDSTPAKGVGDSPPAAPPVSGGGVCGRMVWGVVHGKDVGRDVANSPSTPPAHPTRREEGGV